MRGGREGCGQEAAGRELPWACGAPSASFSRFAVGAFEASVRVNTGPGVFILHWATQIA